MEYEFRVFVEKISIQSTHVVQENTIKCNGLPKELTIFCTLRASMVSDEWSDKWLDLVLPEDEKAA